MARPGNAEPIYDKKSRTINTNDETDTHTTYRQLVGCRFHLASSFPQAFPVEGSRKGSQIFSMTAARFSMKPREAAMERLALSLLCSLLDSKARAIHFSIASRVACKHRHCKRLQSNDRELSDPKLYSILHFGAESGPLLPTLFLQTQSGSNCVQHGPVPHVASPGRQKPQVEVWDQRIWFGPESPAS